MTSSPTKPHYADGDESGDDTSKKHPATLRNRKGKALPNGDISTHRNGEDSPSPDEESPRTLHADHDPTLRRCWCCRRRTIIISAIIAIALTISISAAPSPSAEFLELLPVMPYHFDFSTITDEVRHILTFEDDRPGQVARRDGMRHHLPVIMVPGIVSTGLEVWEGEDCAKAMFRQRMWGSTSMLRTILMDSRCWLRHIQLDPQTGMDPPGIKLRPSMGMEAADYLFPTYWVWSKIIQSLADIGYDSNNMFMAPYDWRLSYKHLEVRDFHFSKLKTLIEVAMKANKKRKVVIVTHSMGAQHVHYFLKWVESHNGGDGGDRWVDSHIDSVVSIGGTYLGVVKSYSSLFSGEMKESAYLASYLDWFRQKVFMSQTDVVHFMRSIFSVPSMIPKGGDAVWGNADDEYCPNYGEYRNEFTAEWWPMSEGINATTYQQRNAFLTFTSNHSHVEMPEPRHFTLDEAMTLLNNTAPQYKAFIDTLYSHGDGVHLDMNISDHDQRYWANPLESRLPHAPSLKIYCMYGVGRSTERGYVYRHKDAEVPPVDSFVPHWTINTSYSEHSAGIISGVKLSDGDGSVSLLSLGYMCARGWRDNAHLNPANVTVVNREHIELNASLASVYLRSPMRVEHVDFIGNAAMLNDLIKIVGVRSRRVKENLHRIDEERERRAHVFEQEHRGEKTEKKGADATQPQPEREIEQDDSDDEFLGGDVTDRVYSCIHNISHRIFNNLEKIRTRAPI